MLHFRNALWLSAGCLLLFLARTTVAETPSAAKILLSGDLATGQAALEKYLDQNPSDDRERFGLGMVQFVRAVETMSQSFYQCGVRNHRAQLPFLRIVTAENPNPQATSYQDVRTIMQRLIDDLTVAEETLAKVDDQRVKLPLSLFQIRLDLNGDGETSEQETLGAVAVELQLARQEAAGGEQPIVVAFDYADCLWLRGYCNLLCGVAESYLAYDMQELHDRVGFLFFQKIDSPHAYLANAPRGFGVGGVDVIDFIAMIHLINFPVKDAQRLQAAHAHFLQVIALSRRTWDAIEKEDDNDREWIPGPGQTSAVAQVRMTPEMVKTWRAFLDELEAILQGEKLVRHARIIDGRAINVKKVFFEPREFDLVMWVQGSAATPYLEKGPTTDVEFWNGLNRVYGGQFYNMAAWFN